MSASPSAHPDDPPALPEAWSIHQVHVVLEKAPLLDATGYRDTVQDTICFIISFLRNLNEIIK